MVKRTIKPPNPNYKPKKTVQTKLAPPRKKRKLKKQKPKRTVQKRLTDKY